MTPRARTLFGVVVLAVAGGLALAAPPPLAPAATPSLPEADVPEGSSPPSVFARLTSRRWAYGAGYQRESLPPVPNPHPAPDPQPIRDHPYDVALLPDGSKAYVTLLGSELHPGSEVAVYDVAKGAVVKRISLVPQGIAGAPSSGPFRVAVHPQGRFVVVTNRLSNHASVIDSRTDRVVEEIPLDFYSQGLAFSKDGKTAWVANRALDQLFTVDLKPGAERLEATLRVRKGLDERAFTQGTPSVHARLVARCGNAGCHDRARGSFVAGADATESFLSTLRHLRPGRSGESRLLRAVTRTREGGTADRVPLYQGHAMGTVVFSEPAADADYRAIAAWIDSAQEGPGIPVGNPRSKPKIVALSPDERFAFVGNTGTQDISVVSTEQGEEVGSIFLQNVVNDLAVHVDPASHKAFLFVTTLGVGFGVAKERDPFGAESWDTGNPAAHFSVHRELDTGRVLPKAEQDVLGPMDAVDGTAAIKFRDIQNDVVVIDLSTLKIPERRPAVLTRLASPNRYEAHRGWVRYTSDTAESTFGDVKGDIPPELMRVVGAFPEKMALAGDRLFVSMQASASVQEWRIDAEAKDPSDRLVPVASWPTGLQPIGLAAGAGGTVAEGKLFVANFLSGTLSVVDRKAKTSVEVPIDRSMARLPFPATNAERGELLVHTAAFSSDGDTSCFHCHYFDMGDGRPWGVSQVVGQEYTSADAGAGELIIGGAMGVPQMRNLFRTQPFFLEGTLSAFEPRSMLMEHAPAEDFAGPTPQGDFTFLVAHHALEGAADVQSSMDARATVEASLEERRDELFRQVSLRHFGKAFTLRDFQRFVGEWQIHEPRLLPNPFDEKSRSVLRGQRLFEDPQVGCVSCHPAPDFTRKQFPGLGEQPLPPLVTLTPRDAAFTLIGMNRLDAINGIKRDLEPWDRGRVEAVQGRFTTLQLRGLWDRPPVFLHGGVARSVREVLAPPGHVGLERFPYEPLLGGEPERPGRKEIGFNETLFTTELTPHNRPFFTAGGRIGQDTHGGTSQLRTHELDDLVDYLESLP